MKRAREGSLRNESCAMPLECPDDRPEREIGRENEQNEQKDRYDLLRTCHYSCVRVETDF